MVTNRVQQESTPLQLHIPALLVQQANTLHPPPRVHAPRAQVANTREAPVNLHATRVPLVTTVQVDPLVSNRVALVPTLLLELVAVLAVLRADTTLALPRLHAPPAQVANTSL